MNDYEVDCMLDAIADVAPHHGETGMITITGKAFDAATREWTMPVTYEARNHREAMDWMAMNREWFKDMEIVPTPVTL